MWWWSSGEGGRGGGGGGGGGVRRRRDDARRYDLRTTPLCACPLLHRCRQPRKAQRASWMEAQNTPSAKGEFAHSGNMSRHSHGQAHTHKQTRLLVRVDLASARLRVHVCLCGLDAVTSTTNPTSNLFLALLRGRFSVIAVVMVDAAGTRFSGHRPWGFSSTFPRSRRCAPAAAVVAADVDRYR